MESKQLVQGKHRKVNMEVLRILAMLMIISLHYFGKGETLLVFTGDNFTENAYFARFFEALSVVSVNIYILISGYFLVDSKFKIEKIVQLWLQIFFYSAGIFLIFKALGRIPEIYDNFYYTNIFLTPIALKHNWFPSIYLILYALSPFLAVMVKKVTKKQLQALIVILLVIFSKIPQMLFPLGIGFDDDGYGIIWMICLFVVAGYIKLYVPISGKWIKKLGWYLFASLLTFISYFVISFIYLRYGKLDNFTDIFYHYNSPTTIVASIALFLAFLNLGQKNMGENKKAHKFIDNFVLYIASLTFGIYLIHEHILLRGLWITLWKVPEAFEHWYFMIHYLLVILTVFIICGSIEAIRKFVFSFLYRSRSWLFFQSKMHKFNARMNGEDEPNARNKTKKSLE